MLNTMNIFFKNESKRIFFRLKKKKPGGLSEHVCNKQRKFCRWEENAETET